MFEEVSVETFQGQTTRHELFGKSWKTQNPRAVVCIIHGFGEHIGRYDHVVSEYTTSNISCYGIDLPGHGRSSGKKGTVQSLQDYILAVDFIYEKAVLENKDLPVFLYGHSMGGGIVLRYLLLTSLPPAGAIITSPWLSLVKKPNAFELVLGRMLLSFGLNKNQTAKLDPKSLSRDESVGKNYLEDPQVHNTASIRLYFAMNDNGVYLLDRPFDFRTQILLAHGTADTITDFKASKTLAKRHHDQITFKEWKDLRHETHNEINSYEVLRYYKNWILDKS